MSNSSRRKAETLGMSPGTAMSRLRKMILFQLVQRVGEDTCYRCGKKIESVEELSIEHKEQWIGKDPQFFGIYQKSRSRTFFATVSAQTITQARVNAV